MGKFLVMETEKIIQILFLTHSTKKRHSSFYFDRFPKYGFIISAEEIVLRLENEGFLTHEGYFEGTSRIIKNILITEKGKNFLLFSVNNDFFDNIKKINCSEFYKDFLINFIPKVIDNINSEKQQNKT